MKKPCALILIALIAAFAVPALAGSVDYGTMMVDNCEEWVSLRDGPDTSCARLAKVPLFAIVTDAVWTPDCGDFIRCCYNGRFGYILSKYLVPWADPEPDPDAADGGGEDPASGSDAAPVRIDWAEATRSLLVVDQDGEYVTIMADEPVADVALLALDLTDGGAFDTTVLYAQNALEPDDPLVVKIAFPGDIPCYGLRFTDGGGETRRYAIAMSGEDGSLLLTAF